MSSQEPTSAARRAYEVVNQALRTGNMDALDEVFTDAVNHNPAPGQARGLAGIKKAFAEFRAAFPDLHLILEDVASGGEKVACRVTIRGTHRGDFQGIPATGRRIRLNGIDILRFEGEKIAERWGGDDTELFKQIGATPPSAAKDQE